MIVLALQLGKTLISIVQEDSKHLLQMSWGDFIPLLVFISYSLLLR